MSSRMARCQYGECGSVFSSKHSMKEHALSHLVADPPKPVYQRARIRRHTSGGWVVVQDLRKETTIDDRGEGSSQPMDVDEVADVGSSSRVTDEVDAFRVKDILPSTSQAGNITTTTTTTTTTGSTSQPVTFSPVLPDRPSQISLPTQSSQSSTHPSQRATVSSPAVSSRGQTSQSREPPSSPFVHTAPSRFTPSPIRSPYARLPVSRSPRNEARRLSPFISDSQVISSTPLDQRPGSPPSPPLSAHGPKPGSTSSEAPASSRLPSGRKSLAFGDALGPSQRSVPNVQSAVTFGFGSR